MIYWYFYLHIDWEVIISIKWRNHQENILQTKLQSLTSSLPVKSFSEHMHSTNLAAKLWGVNVKLKFYLKNKHTNTVLCISDSFLCLYGINWAYDTEVIPLGQPLFPCSFISSPLSRKAQAAGSTPEIPIGNGFSASPWHDEKAVRLEVKGSDHRLI